MIVDMTGSYCAGNIRYLRKKYCVSRRALARLIKMNEIELREIEAGRFRPAFPYPQLKRLCDIFEIPVNALIRKDLSAETEQKDNVQQY